MLVTKELSESFLMEILPVPFLTGSLKLITKLALVKTPVPSSVGVKPTTVGGIVSFMPSNSKAPISGKPLRPKPR